jgi:hypothetical protein
MQKKQMIIDFLTKNPIDKFLKMSEPSAIAFEQFTKVNPDVSYSHFVKVFNAIEIAISNLPVKLTTKNLSEVIDNFPRKHKHGFVSAEIDLMLKKYGIDKKSFNKEMGTNTATVIDGEVVNYNNDIQKTIQCLLEVRTKNVFEQD